MDRDFSKQNSITAGNACVMYVDDVYTCVLMGVACECANFEVCCSL